MQNEIDIKKYIKSNILNLKHRFVGEGVGEDYIKLNTNENNYGLPADFLKDIGEDIPSLHLNRYPNQDLSRLKSSLAQLYGCESDQVMIDNGASIVLSNIFYSVLSKGDSIATLDPSFVLYEHLANLNEADIYKYNFEDDRVEELLISQKPKLIVIANPNNPTGTVMQNDTIEYIIKNTDALVIIDEAYIDFGGQTVVPLLKKYANLIVVRTFSKSFGLAGVRIGVALAHKELISQFTKVQAPFHLNSFTQNVIKTALKYREDFKKHIEDIKATREYLMTNLLELGFKVYKSYANFVCIYDHTNNINLGSLSKYLDEHKIKVMHYPIEIYQKDFLRISIGTQLEIEILLKYIQKYLQNL